MPRNSVVPKSVDSSIMRLKLLSMSSFSCRRKSGCPTTHRHVAGGFEAFAYEQRHTRLRNSCGGGNLDLLLDSDFWCTLDRSHRITMFSRLHVDEKTTLFRQQFATAIITLHGFFAEDREPASELKSIQPLLTSTLRIFQFWRRRPIMNY